MLNRSNKIYFLLIILILIGSLSYIFRDYISDYVNEFFGEKEQEYGVYDEINPEKERLGGELFDREDFRSLEDNFSTSEKEFGNNDVFIKKQEKNKKKESESN